MDFQHLKPFNEGVIYMNLLTLQFTHQMPDVAPLVSRAPNYDLAFSLDVKEPDICCSAITQNT